MDIFRNENPDNNPLVISGYKTRAVREANDEMLSQLLEKLDLLKTDEFEFFSFCLLTILVISLSSIPEITFIFWFLSTSNLFRQDDD